MRICRVKPV
jgi:hypothetical protein